MFIGVGRSISNALRHRIRLVPYDVAAYPPAIPLRRDSDTERDEPEVFRLKAISDNTLHAVANIYVFIVGNLMSPISGVRISQIPPAHPIIPQHPPNFAQNQDAVPDILLNRRLKAVSEVSVRPARCLLSSVLAETPVRRRRNDTLYTFIRQRQCQRISLNYQFFSPSFRHSMMQRPAYRLRFLVAR